MILQQAKPKQDWFKAFNELQITLDTVTRERNCLWSDLELANKNNRELTEQLKTRTAKQDAESLRLQNSLRMQVETLERQICDRNNRVMELEADNCGLHQALVARRAREDYQQNLSVQIKGLIEQLLASQQLLQNIGRPSKFIDVDEVLNNSSTQKEFGS